LAVIPGSNVYLRQTTNSKYQHVNYCRQKLNCQNKAEKNSIQQAPSSNGTKNKTYTHARVYTAIKSVDHNTTSVSFQPTGRSTLWHNNTTTQYHSLVK